MKELKNKTISEVKELTKQFKEQNPDVETPEELLKKKVKVLDMTEVLG